MECQLAIPVCTSRCPLCGQPNACALATQSTGSAPVVSGAALSCWCTEVRIPAEVLARVSEADRGRACVCRRCAEGR